MVVWEDDTELQILFDGLDDKLEIIEGDGDFVVFAVTVLKGVYVVEFDTTGLLLDERDVVILLLAWAVAVFVKEFVLEDDIVVVPDFEYESVGEDDSDKDIFVEAELEDELLGKTLELFVIEEDAVDVADLECVEVALTLLLFLLDTLGHVVEEWVVVIVI